MVQYWEPGIQYDRGAVVEYERESISLYLFHLKDVTLNICIDNTYKIIQPHRSQVRIMRRLFLSKSTFILHKVRLDPSYHSGFMGTRAQGTWERPPTWGE
jgi:hypothetical protein